MSYGSLLCSIIQSYALQNQTLKSTIRITAVTKKILRLIDITVASRYGAIAQLVEHLHGMQGGRGSNPLGSIEF